METKTEISKIMLKVGGKEISLTLQEAKSLSDILSELFGAKITVVPQTIPIIVDRWHPYYPSWPQIWCGSGDSTGTLYMSTESLE